jgi:hypothetical protein
MRRLIAGLAVAALACIAVSTATAAYPKAAVQDAEAKMKASFTSWAKKNLAGTTVGKVTCVLPENGVVVRCTVHVSAAKRYHENIVFQVKETLHDDGTVSWVATSHKCTDTRTGKPFSC